MFNEGKARAEESKRNGYGAFLSEIDPIADEIDKIRAEINKSATGEGESEIDAAVDKIGTNQDEFMNAVNEGARPEKLMEKLEKLNASYRRFIPLSNEYRSSSSIISDRAWAISLKHAPIIDMAFPRLALTIGDVTAGTNANEVQIKLLESAIKGDAFYGCNVWL